MMDLVDTGINRLMVIAPHADDEALGCGGLIALLRRRNVPVHAVFVTDGGASHPGSRAWPRQRLAGQRETEAARSLEILGAGSQPRSFLRLKDADMPDPGAPLWLAARETLANVMRSFDPDMLLLPWRRDPHCDHRNAWRLAQDAMRHAGATGKSLEYAIWLDELGVEGDHPRCAEAQKLALDVGAVLPQKIAAIEAHVSQTSNLIDDDPSGFRLTSGTIARLAGPVETYWRPRS